MCSPNINTATSKKPIADIYTQVGMGAGEPDPKAKSVTDYQLDSRNTEEYMNRMLPYFNKEDIQKGTLGLSTSPKPTFFNENTNVGGEYDPKTKGAKLNISDYWKPYIKGTLGHENRHIEDVAMGGYTHKGFEKLQGDMEKYFDTEKVKTTKQKMFEYLKEKDPEQLKKLGIKSLEDITNTMLRETSQSEIRPNLEALRTERLNNKKGNWWDEWKTLEGIDPNNPSLIELRKVMKDEDIIKILNTFASNNQTTESKYA